MTGAGRRARRRLPRLLGRDRRARRLGDRHLQPLLEDGPRRPALPAELRPRPRPRGTAGAPAHGPARAAPRLPDAVPGADPRRGQRVAQDRDRAQHVRRDGHDARRPGAPRAARRGRARATTGRRTATARSPARRRSSWCPRWRRASPRAPTSSTTARPTTCGWCSRSSARRSASARVCLNRAEVTGLLEEDGRAAGVMCRDLESGEHVRDRGRQRDQRDRRLGRPDPPRGDPRRGRGAADRPQPRHAHHPRARQARLGEAACIVPAGSERTIFALPWYGRALVGTTDEDFDGDIDHVRSRWRRHRVPAGGDQRVLRHTLDRGRHHRRLCRRPAADLDRRPEKVGGHLAQGRAVRDLIRGC